MQTEDVFRSANERIAGHPIVGAIVIEQTEGHALAEKLYASHESPGAGS